MGFRQCSMLTTAHSSDAIMITMMIIHSSCPALVTETISTPLFTSYLSSLFSVHIYRAYLATAHISTRSSRFVSWAVASVVQPCFLGISSLHDLRRMDIFVPSICTVPWKVKATRICKIWTRKNVSYAYFYFWEIFREVQCYEIKDWVTVRIWGEGLYINSHRL